MSVLLTLQRLVAFASKALQSLAIDYPDDAARIGDGPELLYMAGNVGYGGAAYPEHLGQEFLC